MRLNQLAIFAAIAKHRNLTRASTELGVSQPWVSQQLRLLETNYGATFCLRNSRGVDLTEAGRRFLSNVAPILIQVAQLESVFKVSPEMVQPAILKVGASISSSGSFLPRLLARFQKKHHGLEIDFKTRDSSELEKLLLGSAVDLAISTHRPHSPDIAWEPFTRRKIVMFVSPTHRLAKRCRLKLREVLQYPLVARFMNGRQGTTENLIGQFTAAGLEVKIAVRCETPDAVKAAVKGNMGIGLLFEDIVKLEARRGEFKILEVHGLKMEGESFIIYPKNRTLSPVAQEFLELLRRSRPKNGKNEPGKIEDLAGLTQVA